MTDFLTNFLFTLRAFAGIRREIFVTFRFVGCQTFGLNRGRFEYAHNKVTINYGFKTNVNCRLNKMKVPFG